MNKQQAIAFLAQVANDFMAALPTSAKEPFRQSAQQAIQVLEMKDPPDKEEK